MKTLFTEEGWRAVRLTTVGASEIAALFGCHPYLSEYQLWLQKTGREIKDPDENLVMRRGRRLEGVAFDIFAETKRDEIQVVRNQLPNLHWYDKGRLSSTPDGVCFWEPERWPVQVKTVTEGAMKDWSENGIPRHVRLQCMQDAVCLGVTRCLLLVLACGYGCELKEFTIQVESDFEVDAQAKAERFFEYVLADEPPPIDAYADQAFISHLPVTVGKRIDLPQSLFEEIDRWRSYASDAKRNTDFSKIARAKIQAAMGDAEEGYIGGQLVLTNKEVTKKEHTVKASAFRQLRYKGEGIDGDD